MDNWIICGEGIRKQFGGLVIYPERSLRFKFLNYDPIDLLIVNINEVIQGIENRLDAIVDFCLHFGSRKNVNRDSHRLLDCEMPLGKRSARRLANRLLPSLS